MPVFKRIAGRIDVRRLMLTLVSRGLSTIFSFALIFSLARVLSAEEYGLYAMLFSIGSALGLVLTSGQATLIVKHFNREDPPGDNINRQLISHNVVWQAVALALVWVAGWLVWATGVGQLSPIAILAVLIFSSVFLLSEYFQSYFRARNQLKLALVPRENFWRPFATVLVWFSVFLGVSLGGATALLLVAACLAVAVIYQSFFFVRDARRRSETGAASSDETASPSNWDKESIYFGLNGFMTAVALHIEVVIVGFVLGLEEVALFFVLFRLAMLLNLPQISMETFAMPMIAERMREGDRKEAQKLLSAFAAVTFLLSLAGAAVLVPLSPYVVKLFNPEFEVSGLLMLAIASQTVVMAFFGLGTSTLMISGGERYFLLYRSVLYAIYAVSLVLFGWIGGLMGVALTMTGFVLIEHMLAAAWCRRKAGVDITATGAIRVFATAGG